jgi:hypothetical protein
MDRIVELGRQVWSLLTEDEHERYYMVGTLTFVEDIVGLLNITDFDWNDEYNIDSIHDKIFD